jgi:hypothetical protein
MQVREKPGYDGRRFGREEIAQGITFKRFVTNNRQRQCRHPN